MLFLLLDFEEVIALSVLLDFEESRKWREERCRQRQREEEQQEEEEWVHRGK